MSPSADPISWRGMLRLRSAAIGLVALGTLGARVIVGEAVPLSRLLVLVTIWAATQWFASRSRNTPGPPVLAGLMALDIGVLGLVFTWTGGPMNPFTFLTLTHLALAAVVLPPRWAWTVGVWAATAFGLLFLVPSGSPMPPDGHLHGAGGNGTMALHLRGMWVGYVLAGTAMIGFVGRIARALSERDRALAEARETAERSARLASLATLAAGAAHELGTPLGTIAIAARELERSLDASDVGDEILSDVRLIGEEVSRCREVLVRLRTDAGDPGGESPARCTPTELLDSALADLQDRVRITLDPSAPDTISVFPHTTADAIRDVARNAVAASQGEAVEITVDGEDGSLRIRVRDQGPGMDAETLRRATEPFFTTRPTGQGMGLGLFLARTVAERTGGRLDLQSLPGEGTTVTLVFTPVIP